MVMQAKMSEEEYRGSLKKFGLGTSEAAQLIWIKTGSVIRPQVTETHLNRYGSLSHAYTAVYRFLFREMEREHGQIR